MSTFECTTTLEDFDFAILVLTPDDLTVSRGTEKQSPRDNVVFELGLFIGALGRTRTFIVYDRTKDIKLPSDLAGITPATFQPPDAGSFQSALGACSTLIQGAIAGQGVRKRSGADATINPGVEYQVLAALLDIAALRFIILMAETGVTLPRGGPFILGLPYAYSIGGRGMGNGYFGVDKMCEKLADANLLTIDLRLQVGLSERGRAFAAWLVTAGHKAEYFASYVGTWGVRPPHVPELEDPSTAPRTLFDIQARAEQQQRQARDAAPKPPMPPTPNDTPPSDAAGS